MSLPSSEEMDAIVLQLTFEAKCVKGFQESQRKAGRKTSQRKLIEGTRFKTAADIVARVRDLALGGERDRYGRSTITRQSIERYGPFADDDDERAAVGTEASEPAVAPSLSSDDAEILKFVRANGGFARVRKIVSAWSEELS